ncbi:hypothetical protein PCC6311_1061 [Synechococcus elongatus PCC 6311]|nr:hypothetical protein PCC7943_1061 [Synechococcus elongatus PCC 7943]UOW73539.1 hypothetical protein PCC6311_1061 [Synechococcus elongatus PCC 6311]UOW76259.1 hypothetical protein PCC6301pg_1061 [Synechococcus elongatus PCC 6301]
MCGGGLNLDSPSEPAGGHCSSVETGASVLMLRASPTNQAVAFRFGADSIERYPMLSLNLIQIDGLRLVQGLKQQGTRSCKP